MLIKNFEFGHRWNRAVETFPWWPFRQYSAYKIASIALPLGKFSMDDWLLENSGLTLSTSS
jgi:hypothetical protein